MEWLSIREFSWLSRRTSGTFSPSFQTYYPSLHVRATTRSRPPAVDRRHAGEQDRVPAEPDNHVMAICDLRMIAYTTTARPPTATRCAASPCAATCASSTSPDASGGGRSTSSPPSMRRATTPCSKVTGFNRIFFVTSWATTSSGRTPAGRLRVEKNEVFVLKYDHVRQLCWREVNDLRDCAGFSGRCGQQVRWRAEGEARLRVLDRRVVQERVHAVRHGHRNIDASSCGRLGAESKISNVQSTVTSRMTIIRASAATKETCSNL
jgi:hypothetical protein